MKLYSELFCTYSMEEKNRVIHILEEHQIPYKISTNGNTMRNLGSRGMALIDSVKSRRYPVNTESVYRRNS